MTQSFDNILLATSEILLRRDLCKCAADPKFGGDKTPVYIPTSDKNISKNDFSNPGQIIEFDLEKDEKSFYSQDANHGLLYVPYPYLVPGGRFNEMYGWDTAFPVFAWASQFPKVMREQVDNHLYQINHYGKILNANRTYYIGRSHPPLISMMVVAILDANEHIDWKNFDPEGVYKDTNSWLSYAYDTIQKYHSYWMDEKRLDKETGLSHYWDEGEVPAPEVVADEKGHYEHAKEHFKSNHNSDPDAHYFYDQQLDELTPLYYRADRTMRSSGYDPTGHWGYGALRCLFHITACLNSLLFKMEKDMALFANRLGKNEDEEKWIDLSKKRKTNMDKYLLDELTGLYCDYDYMKKEENKKPFATQFIPLWAGLYDDNLGLAKKASQALIKNHETPHGIVTSTEYSGSQWDSPYGWPPLQYFAIEGLNHCGLVEDSKRIAEKYVSLALDVFEKNGSLFEKYNVIEGNADIKVINGYNYNVSESGTFLWTAATLASAQKILGSKELKDRLSA